MSKHLTWVWRALQISHWTSLFPTYTSLEHVEFCLDDMVNYSWLLTGFTAALKSDPFPPAACRLCVSLGHRCAPTAKKGRSAAASEELPLLPAVLDLAGAMAEADGKGLQGQLHPLVCITTGIWLLSSASYLLCSVAGAERAPSRTWWLHLHVPLDQAAWGSLPTIECS